jgi:transglutaminase-like putative cysteine protease
MMSQAATTRNGDRLMMAVAGLCAFVLPVSLAEAKWAPRPVALAFVCLLSLAFAILIGPLQLPRAVRWPIVIAAGLVLAMSNAGLFHISAQAALSRMGGWATDLSARRTVEDPGLVMFWTTCIVWWAGYSAMHGIVCGGRALEAMLPTLLTLSLNVLYTRQHIGYILAILFGLVILMAWTAQTRRQTRWTEQNIDYPDASAELMISAFFIAGLVCVFAWVLPAVTSRTTVEWLKEMAHGPVSDTRQVFRQLLGGADLSNVPALPDESEASLPTSRSIGNPPDLAENVVMWVWTDEPTPMPPEIASHLPPDEMNPPVDKINWRGLTYSTYTGRGWSNPSLTEKPFVPVTDTTLSTQSYTLTQKYEIVSGHGDTEFAANQPVSTTARLTALYRPGTGIDLAGLRGTTSQYTVTSRVVRADEETLQEAPATYLSPQGELRPDIAPYLQLPNRLPQRVRNLAMQITADVTTPYDKATRIETFLRTYSYTLDLPPVPEGRDLVDYFLFDAPGGYCDYYASAMVVMLRVVGVPARLASGFVRGEYDFQRGEYRVTAQDAHSWPEVYMAGIGWVEFEPTAAQPTFVRGHRIPVVQVSAEQVRAAETRHVQTTRVIWSTTGIVLLAMALAAFLIRRERKFVALPSDVLIPLLYQRLRRRGVWLGVTVRPSDTPDEFVSAFNRAIEQRAATVRKLRLRPRIKTSQQAAARIGDVYRQASYSPIQPGASEAHEALNAWRAVRWRAWLLGWLSKLPTLRKS